MIEPPQLPARHLIARDFGCIRGDSEVFSDRNLNLEPGEGLLLTGPNGSGKSSLLMCLAGLLPFEGQIDWPGRDTETRPGADIHFLSHLPACKPGLTLRQNLTFWADLNGGDRSKIAPSLTEARLDHAIDLEAGLLSAGQTRRLALCRLLVATRPIWLLDEPTSALDTQGEAWVGNCIDSHLAAGGIAIVATHLPLKSKSTFKALMMGGTQ